MLGECRVLNLIFGQIPEVVGLAATKPTPITRLDGERQPSPSRDIQEARVVKCPSKQEARCMIPSVKVGKIFRWENSEGGMFRKNGLPL